MSASTRKTKELASARKGSTPAAAAAGASLIHTLARGSGSVTAARYLGRGGGSAAAARPFVGAVVKGAAAAAADPITGALSKGAATAPSSIDGSGGGAFPCSSSFNSGFSFPPSPSPAWCDAAGADPISPAFGRSAVWDPSWDKDPRPSGGFLSYFAQNAKSDDVGAEGG